MKILRHSQIFGAAPYPIDLSSFSNPKPRGKLLEKQLQLFHLLWTIFLYIFYYYCLYRCLPNFSHKNFILALMDFVTCCLDISILTLIFTGSRRFHGQYRLVMTRIGGILFAFHQYGLRIEIRKLWKIHRMILLLVVILLIPLCSYFFSRELTISIGFKIAITLYCEWIPVLCLTQYVYTMGLIREILRCSNSMLKNVKNPHNKHNAEHVLNFVGQKIYVICMLAEEVIQMFGVLTILELLLINIFSGRMLWNAAWIYSLNGEDNLDIPHTLYSLSLVLLQWLKLAIITYPQSSMKYEVRQ